MLVIIPEAIVNTQAPTVFVPEKPDRKAGVPLAVEPISGDESCRKLPLLKFALNAFPNALAVGL